MRLIVELLLERTFTFSEDAAQEYQQGQSNSISKFRLFDAPGRFPLTAGSRGCNLMPSSRHAAVQTSKGRIVSDLRGLCSHRLRPWTLSPEINQGLSGGALPVTRCCDLKTKLLAPCA